MRAVQGCLRDPRRAAIDALAIGEGAARGGGDGVGVVRVSVIKIVIVDDVGVVERGVVNVDVVHVAEASVIPGMVRFAPTQWKPAHAETDAEANAKTETAAQETDIGWAIEGRSPNWTG